MDLDSIRARIAAIGLQSGPDARGLENTARSADTWRSADTARSSDTGRSADTARSSDTGRSADTARSSDTARKFQAVFTTILAKEMRRGLQDGFFGQGSAGDIYSGWLDEKIGQVMADRDALHMQRLLGDAFARAEGNVSPGTGEARER